MTGDQEVGFDDLISVLAEWGPCPGCPEDIDGSGDVGFNDLLEVLGQWGPCLFEYGPIRDNPAAEQIGLELLGSAGPLLLPDANYDRIDRDMSLIRAAFPELAGVGHTMAWAPTQVMVSIIDGAPTDEYDAMNTFMQLESQQQITSTIVLLTFPGKLNIPRLGVEYAALPNIQWAEPNGLIGGAAFWDRTIQPGDVWRWTVDDGFLDCFDGCDCHRFWTIDVAAEGTVTLVNYDEFGAPWCEF